MLHCTQPPTNRQSAAQTVDSSVKDPALKLSLLTRALEESRAKIAHLQQDSAAVADALLQLCLEAGAPTGSDSCGADHVGQAAAGSDPAQGAGSADSSITDGSEDSPVALHIDQLSTRLSQLREALAMQEVAAAEARAAHERAALQVVAQQQQREALEQQLEEVRWGAVWAYR